MTGNVSMASAMPNLFQLQVKMRDIKQAGAENAAKMLDTPKPRLSYPLPGSNYGTGVNLYA